jgi:hypothetical protein
MALPETPLRRLPYQHRGHNAAATTSSSMSSASSDNSGATLSLRTDVLQTVKRSYIFVTALLL